MIKKLKKSDHGTPEQIVEHYQLEKKLADKLRNSSREERAELYTEVYDELFTNIPYHSQLTRKADDKSRQISVYKKLQLLKHYLKPDSTFLEVGPGDCSLSLAVCQQVKQVYAVDVSSEVTENNHHPENFKLIISDGVSIPVATNSVTIAYSDQLMEHLHPDDAFLQLQNIYQSLAESGIYICITPNRLSGPHDVSKYFDETATCFHLKEYTVTELINLFSQVGFINIKVSFGFRGVYLQPPLFIYQWTENFLNAVPFVIRNKLTSNILVNNFLGITIIAKKKNK
ncbi:MAG: class I SAM-dependent methyltransferase [Pleurocapsa minor HA4230-MV1]|nr:class I SAM-dependent methyltransferase [Pleurocapsa minor HA4230-MV1]